MAATGRLDDWDVRDNSALCQVSSRLAHTYSHGMAGVHGQQPHHTKNGNTQVPCKFLLTNMFPNILLAKSNYTVESRIRVGRTTNYRVEGIIQQGY